MWTAMLGEMYALQIVGVDSLESKRLAHWRRFIDGG